MDLSMDGARFKSLLYHGTGVVGQLSQHVLPIAFFLKNKFLPKDILTDFLGTTAGSGLGINLWPRESSSHVKDKVS